MRALRVRWWQRSAGRRCESRCSVHPSTPPWPLPSLRRLPQPYRRRGFCCHLERAAQPHTQPSGLLRHQPLRIPHKPPAPLSPWPPHRRQSQWHLRLELYGRWRRASGAGHWRERGVRHLGRPRARWPADPTRLAPLVRDPLQRQRLVAAGRTNGPGAGAAPGPSASAATLATRGLRTERGRRGRRGRR